MAETNFFEQQVTPGLARATDSTSLQLLLSATLGVTTTHQEDESIHNQWRDHQRWSSETTRWGDDYGIYAISYVLALGQTYLDHDNGINHLRALIANSIMTTTLKISVRRERPNHANALSFPSGHTSDAFTTATSLTYAYGWKAAVMAYPLATFVGLSRIADDEHWASDVVAGAFIGIWMGRSFFYSDEKKEKIRAPSFTWQVFPEIEGSYEGLRVAVEF